MLCNRVTCVRVRVCVRTWPNMNVKFVLRRGNRNMKGSQRKTEQSNDIKSILLKL